MDLNHVVQMADEHTALNALTARQLKVAHDVRRRAEAFARERDYEENLHNMCGVTSVALETALRRAGADARLTCGRFGGIGHFWVDVHERDDPTQIIDLTATQFDKYFFTEPLPRVLVTRYIDELGNWYNRIEGDPAAARQRLHEDSQFDAQLFEDRTRAWLSHRRRRQ